MALYEKFKKAFAQNIWDKIIIHSSKFGPIITFSDVSGNILTDNFYKKRSTDKKEERKRIVLEAAEIT